MIKVFFLGLGLGYHVININLYLMVDHIMEQSYHGSLISCPSILQPKRHHLVTEGAPLCNEGRLLHVFKSHLDLVVAKETIHEGEDFMLCGVVDQNINVGKREVILGAYPVQVSITIHIRTLSSFFGIGTTLATHYG